MPEEMQARIAAMFRGDRIFALGFVVVLWVVVLFVYFSVRDTIGGGAIANVLVVAGALVLLFNTAAIFAMIRQYAAERDFIYGLDIRHLDEMKRAKRNR